MKKLLLPILLFLASNCFALSYGDIKVISRALARDPIPDSGSPRISNSYISTYTYIAQQDIVLNSFCLETSTNISISAGKRIYNLPSDLIAVKKVSLDNNTIRSTSLSKKDMKDRTWLANISTATPNVYFWEQGINTINFDTFPSTATDKIITVTYLKQPNP
jgi:hypothetical protein